MKRFSAVMLGILAIGCNTVTIKDNTGCDVRIDQSKHIPIGNADIAANLGDKAVDTVGSVIGGAVGAGVSGPAGAAAGVLIGKITASEVSDLANMIGNADSTPVTKISGE